MVQTRGLDVDEQGLFELSARRCLDLGSGRQQALDSVVTALHQSYGHGFQLFFRKLAGLRSLEHRRTFLRKCATEAAVQFGLPAGVRVLMASSRFYTT